MDKDKIVQPKSLEIINKIRNGETVICPVCGKGEIKATGDSKISHHFECTNCGKGININ